MRSWSADYTRRAVRSWLETSVCRAVADARPSRAAFVVLGRDLVLQSARHRLEQEEFSRPAEHLSLCLIEWVLSRCALQSVAALETQLGSNTFGHFSQVDRGLWVWW
jgi:hypothetical protein